MKLRCRIPLPNFELDIDAHFDARVTAIFGPSGAGKTTLLDGMAGLRPIAEGEIEIASQLLFSSTSGVNLPPRRRGIGYVPQEGALFPHLSVRKNILFGARRAAGAAGSNGISMEHVVEILEIAHLLNRTVIELSGGEARRAALARAILSHPRMLLLDEPLAALDIGLKERILPYLARVRDELAIPMVYVTHDVSEVLMLADWVLMLRQGKLIAQGVPQTALRSTGAVLRLPDEGFENVLAASFMDSDAAAGTTRVRLPFGVELTVPYSNRPPDGVCRIAISADDILVADRPPIGISASNTLAGTIQKIEQAGGEALITVNAGDEFLVRLTASAVERLALRETMPVFLVLKSRSCRLL
jgi:molybdate transport system ATP-binding protein